METPYSPVANIWGFGMSVSGLNRGLVRYVQRLPITAPADARILDAGCGTGILGYALLKRFPAASVLATDADARMCRNARRFARRRSISPEQFCAAQADIHAPRHVTHGDDTREVLPPASFDIVAAGAVLEHTDLSRSIPALAELVRPGGWFVNVGMHTNPFVRVYEVAFGVRRIPQEEYRTYLDEAGMEHISSIPLTPREFPTNVTRRGIIARKRA